jgi:hypothetical protein
MLYLLQQDLNSGTFMSSCGMWLIAASRGGESTADYEAMKGPTRKTLAAS